MKKITTFLALLLTCIIGATAADFVPKDGTKYLIKCKGNSNVVYTPENSNILQAQQSVSDASYFTFESKVVEKVTYFYIHPAGDATKYVYITQAPSNDNNANDGVVGVTETKDDATCLWKITFNKGNNNPCAFNITPKGYDDSSWNCRANGIGYWRANAQGGNDKADNSWYITPNVELNGYYTIKNTATDRRTNLYNDFGVDKITRAAQELPTTLTNNYVWHVTTANNNVLTVLNGQGTPLYHDGNASLPTLKVAYSDGTKYYFGEALNCGNDRRGYKLTLWKDGDYSVADNQWTFAPVEVSNIYNVVCNIEDGYVTYNATSEKAKNGGFFILSSAPQVADLTAATVEYYDAAVTVDGNNINVTYTCRLEELKQDAKEALAKTGVGYPTATAATRTALANVVEGTDASAILNAFKAFKTNKDEIQMPEDGKAYVITNIHKAGGKRYMKYQADGTSMVARDDAAELPIEATYICHKVDGKYVFANNSGTYLTWRGNATDDCTNDNKGYTTSYDADYNTFTVAANPNVFGCLSFGAKRDHYTHTQSYYIVTSTGSFQKAGFNDYYDENNSSAFTFEEVTYPNTITFHDAQNINGVSHIATFSAPFATIIPANVKAYYVSAKGAEATMTAIDAQAIPANQGVILTSESGDAATMVPAAGETAATITGNQLGHSAGAAKALTAGVGYILGNGTEGTAFYPCKAGSLPINKAYLLGNGGESAIAMNFGNAVTGINTIAAPASAKAPIFDLSGRRVVKATKGLYIQNGKKVIVK
ncbi:putative uncharacterized protein [Prevotella sp. CAG:5226]|nr:putative uncharacterized protein [Prevotella sp. CAG:5226]